jgi:RNA recognition motif-containing protein
VFVRGLPRNITTDEMLEMFGEYGSVLCISGGSRREVCVCVRARARACIRFRAMHQQRVTARGLCACVCARARCRGVRWIYACVYLCVYSYLHVLVTVGTLTCMCMFVCVCVCVCLRRRAQRTYCMTLRRRRRLPFEHTHTHTRLPQTAGTAYILYKFEEEAQAAIRALSGLRVHQHSLVLQVFIFCLFIKKNPRPLCSSTLSFPSVFFSF